MEQLNLFYCYRAREREDGTWIVHDMFTPPNIGTTGYSREYDSFDAMPKLLKEKIAAIDLCKTDEDIKDVGRKHPSVPPTYWCYTEEPIFDHGANS